MKKSFIILLSVLLISLISACGSAKLSKSELLSYVDEICNNSDRGVQISSNAYTYIEAKRDIYQKIIDNGDATVKVFVEELEKSDVFGLDKYIMAAACAEITGIGKYGGWSSGKEWLDLYKAEK